MLGVVEEWAVTIAVAKAESRWRRAKLAWEAITWIVARDPEVGVPITDSGKTRTLQLVGARSIDEPTVTVVYVIEDGRIVIHDARFEDASSDAGFA